MAKIEN